MRNCGVALALFLTIRKQKQKDNVSMSSLLFECLQWGLHPSFDMQGNGDGSGDNYRRHTTYQTQQLEEFFKHCSHPDGAQQKQLSTELGLERKQIKYWFQNRRTQEKAQHEKADFHTLKLKYKKLKRKYQELKETCDKLKCRECMGSLIGRAPQLLPNENINEEDARGLRQAPVPQVQPLPTTLDLTLGLTGQGLCGSFDKQEMVEMATRAMDELTQLLESCDPFWVRSPVDGRLILDVDIYSKNFSWVNHFHNFSRLESSKDSSIVGMSAKGLVDMFMDPNKWLDLFPTIVAKARKIEMLDASILGDDAGTMLL